MILSFLNPKANSRDETFSHTYKLTPNPFQFRFGIPSNSQTTLLLKFMDILHIKKKKKYPLNYLKDMNNGFDLPE